MKRRTIGFLAVLLVIIAGVGGAIAYGSGSYVANPFAKKKKPGETAASPSPSPSASPQKGPEKGKK